jgi:hypothetical protein
MAVPSPSVKPTAIVGGTLHFRYVGAVGVSGAAVALNVDLTEMELQLRQSLHFVDQLQVVFKALDEGITAVTPVILGASDFHGSPIEYLTILVTSDNVANDCLIEVVLPHSVVR